MEGRQFNISKSILSDLNQKLSEEISETINDDVHVKSERKWENQNNLTVLKNHLEFMRSQYSDENSDITNLVEVQIGLAKFVDFYYINNYRKNRIIILVNSIVGYAATVLQHSITSNFSCAQHEDQACIGGGLGSRYISGSLTASNGDVISSVDAINFIMAPQHVILPRSTIIYRVINRTVNNPYGSYWMLDLPGNRKNWRSSLAVLTQWNKNNNYVQLSVPHDTYAWYGLAASQRVIDSNDKIQKCILPGGGEQLWIDPLRVQSMQNSCLIRNTNWL